MEAGEAAKTAAAGVAGLAAAEAAGGVAATGGELPTAAAAAAAGEPNGVLTLTREAGLAGLKGDVAGDCCSWCWCCCCTEAKGCGSCSSVLKGGAEAGREVLWVPYGPPPPGTVSCCRDDLDGLLPTLCVGAGAGAVPGAAWPDGRGGRGGTPCCGDGGTPRVAPYMAGGGCAWDAAAAAGSCMSEVGLRWVEQR